MSYTFRELLKQNGVIVFDGAMGTLQMEQLLMLHYHLQETHGDPNYGLKILARLIFC